MITVDTTIGELKKNNIIGSLFRYLIFNISGDGAGNYQSDDISLSDINYKNPTWNVKDMVYGLNCLVENGKTGIQLLYQVYPKEDIGVSPDKEFVQLIYFPSKIISTKKSKPVILAAGGGYGAVCSMAESFPVATRLSELGFSVFCLNYRVADGKTLFPRPMEDMAATYDFLNRNKDIFQIDVEHYAVGGFSAGGHLAACWGTESLGYRKYKAIKPDLLLLAYPMINVWDTVNVMPEPLKSVILEGYLGAGYSSEASRIYNVDEAIDCEYPAAYIIQAEDDQTVPIWNSKRLSEALNKHQIPCRCDIKEKGLHGFGLGTDTMCYGWVENAVSFWKQLDKGI